MVISNIFLPLLLTVSIEGLIAYGMGWRGQRFFKALLAVNALTNPSINLVSLLIRTLEGGSLFFPVILALEVLVIPAEWFLLSRMLPQKAGLLRLSFIMNISSFLIGMVIL